MGSCVAVSGLLEGLSRFDAAGGYDFTQNLMQRLESRVAGVNRENSFAFMLIDAMSVREEMVSHVQDLGPMRFAASPVVVMIDGTDYVRSIQKANQDGSLTFFAP